MLGADLSGLSFLDLFSCSGQIGLEAYSRGADVVMNELDRRRYRFIAKLVLDWKIENRIEVTSLQAEKLLNSDLERKKQYDILFLDPPYHMQWDEQPFVLKVFSWVNESDVLAPGCSVMIQHAHTVELPNLGSRLTRVISKRYGDTLLSAYKAEIEVQS